MTKEQKFLYDLNFGRSIETQIQKQISGAMQVQGEEASFDLIIPERRIEVKMDRLALKTGNFAVEVAMVDKKNPSGIFQSFADYVCFCNLNGDCYLLKKNELLFYVWREKENIILVANPEQTHLIALIPCKEIKKMAIKNLKIKLPDNEISLSIFCDICREKIEQCFITS